MVITKPNFIRCYITFIFPLIFFIPYLFLKHIFHINFSFDTISNPSNNEIRAIFKYFMLFFGLYLWLFVMIPISLKTLKNSNAVLEVKGEILTCFGESVCLLDSINRVDAFTKFMNLGVTIHFDGGSFDCTQLNLCNKKPAEIKRELENLAGIRQDDKRPDGERSDL
jgi:hypothetical protein